LHLVDGLDRSTGFNRGLIISDFSLSGKVILVTGASSGIGRRVAVACAEMGAQVAVTGRDSARLDATLHLMPGVGHSAIVADLTLDEERARVTKALAPVDGMFFSAGIARIMPFRLITEAHVREILAINLEAPMLLTQSLLRNRLVKPGASLVFNTAAAADSAPAATAAYSAAKAGLKAAVNSLALEVAKNAIRVTCLQLGYVETEMLGYLRKRGMDATTLGALAPLGMGTVDDAANASLYLLSDASRPVSRYSLVADGGGGLFSGT
jgi:NAD(P)-dependent dehydrogenase (short-subunit alcohol dehydrogenase family)